jgi:hypothetical protein
MGPQSRSGRYGEVNILDLTRTRTPPLGLRPVASRYTDCATAVLGTNEDYDQTEKERKRVDEGKIIVKRRKESTQCALEKYSKLRGVLVQIRENTLYKRIGTICNSKKELQAFLHYHLPHATGKRGILDLSGT